MSGATYMRLDKFVEGTHFIRLMASGPFKADPKLGIRLGPVRVHSI